MRYVNEYIDCLLLLSVHRFKEVYISSCDQIKCKAHIKGKGKAALGFWADWIGTLVAMAHGILIDCCCCLFTVSKKCIYLEL